MCYKVLERIIANTHVEYLEEHSLLSHEQFKFRSGRGAEDQLLLIYGGVVELVDRYPSAINHSSVINKDSGRVVDMVFLDLARHLIG